MLLLILFLSTLCLILFPTHALTGAAESLRLCGTAVIPALLPFFFLTRLIVYALPQPKSTRTFLGISSNCWPAIVLSFIGGYPTGVATAVSLYESGKANKQEVQRVLRVCNNSGPGFFVNVIGMKLFRDPLIGVVLYGIHVLSGCLLLLLFTSNTPSSYTIRKIPEQQKSFPQQFQQALGSSCSSMLQVCGLVILFSTLLSILKAFLPASLLPLSGFLEITTGILSLDPSPNVFILCAVLMGWGGLCVHMQSMSIWHSSNLNPEGYWIEKLLHGAISGILAYCVLYGIWIGLFLILTVSYAFSLFRKKWGRKKQSYGL